MTDTELITEVTVIWKCIWNTGIIFQRFIFLNPLLSLKFALFCARRYYPWTFTAITWHLFTIFRDSIQPDWSWACWTIRRDINSRSVKSRTGLQDNSPTNQLAVSQLADWSTRRQRIFKNHGITILYLYIKPNHDCNPVEYWQRINSVICPK